jgi:hypothetical protein
VQSGGSAYCSHHDWQTCVCAIAALQCIHQPFLLHSLSLPTCKQSAAIFLLRGTSFGIESDLDYLEMLEKASKMLGQQILQNVILQAK